MNIALLQMEVRMGDPAANRATAERMIGQAAVAGADTIVLPETWNTGFFPKENLLALAEEDSGGECHALLAREAARHGVNIVGGSLVTKETQAVYNTACVFDRSGREITRYHKIHSFSPSGEHRYFAAGDRLCTFEVDGVKAGLVICYDLRFVELIRLLALEGIQLLFVPAQWPAARVEHWTVLNRARAIENQMFVACVNGCGAAEEGRFGGHSMLISPFGEVLAEAGTEQAIMQAKIDLAQVADIRATINVFRDRRTDIYTLAQKG